MEAIIRAPTVNELAKLNNQSLVEISPGMALQKFVDQLVSYDIQLAVFEQSDLYQKLAEDSLLTSSEIFSGIQEDLSVSRVKHDYYELDNKEKTPFKEIKVSLASRYPELVIEFFMTLIGEAQIKAVGELSSDIAAVKEFKIRDINDQLKSLTLAASTERLAAIRRLEEKNKELIAGLQMQIDLKVDVAEKNRGNQIIRVEEALKTAKALGIVDPVTWDDLRTSRIASQITNEFGGKEKSIPHYFQGSRILSAELERLNSRQDDRPFVSGLAELEMQIQELQNDHKIAALKARQDDTIYIEKFDDLQRELSRLSEIDVKFDIARLAVVSQQPVASPKPTRNPNVIILAGLLLSGILALFVALIRIALRKKEDPPESSTSMPLS